MMSLLRRALDERVMIARVFSARTSTARGPATAAIEKLERSGDCRVAALVCSVLDVFIDDDRRQSSGKSPGTERERKTGRAPRRVVFFFNVLGKKKFYTLFFCFKGHQNGRRDLRSFRQRVGPSCLLSANAVHLGAT